MSLDVALTDILFQFQSPALSEKKVSVGYRCFFTPGLMLMWPLGWLVKKVLLLPFVEEWSEAWRTHTALCAQHGCKGTRMPLAMGDWAPGFVLGTWAPYLLE